VTEGNRRRDSSRWRRQRCRPRPIPSPREKSGVECWGDWDKVLWLTLLGRHSSGRSAHHRWLEWSSGQVMAVAVCWSSTTRQTHHVRRCHQRRHSETSCSWPCSLPSADCNFRHTSP